MDSQKPLNKQSNVVESNTKSVSNENTRNKSKQQKNKKKQKDKDKLVGIQESICGLVIDDKLIYHYLKAIEKIHGNQIRNTFGYISKDFLRVNRLYLVKELTVEKFGEANELFNLFKDFSSLERLSFKNCENFSNLLFYVLAKEIPSDVDKEDEFWSRVSNQKEFILKFKSEMKLNKEINQLRTLILNKHVDPNQKKLELKFLHQLETLNVNNSSTLQNISFLGSLKNPEKLKHLSVDHCLKLNMFEKTDLLKKNVIVTKEHFDAHNNKGYKGVKYYKIEHDGELLTEADFITNDSTENRNIDQKDKQFICNQYVFFDYIALLPQFKNLTDLSLVRTSNVDQRLLQLVSEHCLYVQTLNLHSCIWVNDYSMFEIRKMPMLNVLILSSIPRLTIFSMIILSYLTKNTIKTIVENKDLFFKIMSNPSNLLMVENDATDESNVYFTKEEAELMKQNDCLLILNSVDHKHFTKNKKHIEKIFTKIKEYDFFSNDNLEEYCPDFVLPLRCLDISHCHGIESLDLKIFSNFLFLRELNVESCNLFAPVDNLDKEFYNIIDDLTSKNDQLKLLKTRFTERCQNHSLSIEYLNVNNCTLSSYHKNTLFHENQIENPIKESEDLKCVLETFNFTFLKYMPLLQCLKAGNNLRMVDKTLLYAFFICNDQLNELELENSIHLNMKDCFNKSIGFDFKIVKKLNLSNAPQINNATMQLISTYFENLTELNISQCNKLTDKGFQQSIGTLKNLQYLSVAYCDRLTDKAFKNIDKNNQFIQILDVSGTKIKSIALKQYFPSLPNLYICGLDQCNLIDDESLVYFVTKCKKLKQVSLVKNEGITKAVIAMFQLDPFFSTINVIY